MSKSRAGGIGSRPTWSVRPAVAAMGPRRSRRVRWQCQPTLVRFAGIHVGYTPRRQSRARLLDLDRNVGFFGVVRTAVAAKLTRGIVRIVKITEGPPNAVIVGWGSPTEIQTASPPAPNISMSHSPRLNSADAHSTITSSSSLQESFISPSNSSRSPLQSTSSLFPAVSSPPMLNSMFSLARAALGNPRAKRMLGCVNTNVGSRNVEPRR